MGGNTGKADGCTSGRLSGKNAECVRVVALENVGRYNLCGHFFHTGGKNAAHGETAQRLLFMTERIQIPVVAVAQDCLRGYLPQAGLRFPKRAVGDHKTVCAVDGIEHSAEHLFIHRSAEHGKDFETVSECVKRNVAHFQEREKALADRTEQI